MEADLNKADPRLLPGMRFSEPPTPIPTELQWHYTYLREGETYRKLLEMHREHIPDNQFSFVQEIPEQAEAFSLRPRHALSKEWYLLGSEFTPLYQLKDELGKDEVLRLQSLFVYARILTRRGHYFYLRHFTNWHFNLDTDGKIIIPSANWAERHQQREIINRAHKMIIYGHMTLEEAIEMLATCKHIGSIASEDNFFGGSNHECLRCGFGFSRSFYDNYQVNDDRTESVWDKWPEEVRQVGKDFPSFIYNGIPETPFYRQYKGDERNHSKCYDEAFT